MFLSEHQELAQKLASKYSLSAAPLPCELSEEQLQDLADQMEAKEKQIDIVSRQLSATTKKKSQTCCRKVMQVSNPRDGNIQFLRKMKAITSTLQKNDLSWD